MDPLLGLLLLSLICMAAMVQMMSGGRRRWMGWDRTSSTFNDRSETPREILDGRYASGHITKDSYQAMLVDLRPGRVAG